MGRALLRAGRAGAGGSRTEQERPWRCRAGGGRGGARRPPAARTIGGAGGQACRRAPCPLAAGRREAGGGAAGAFPCRSAAGRPFPAGSQTRGGSRRLGELTPLPPPGRDALPRGLRPALRRGRRARRELQVPACSAPRIASGPCVAQLAAAPALPWPPPCGRGRGRGARPGPSSPCVNGPSLRCEGGRARSLPWAKFKTQQWGFLPWQLGVTLHKCTDLHRAPARGSSHPNPLEVRRASQTFP